MKTHDEINFATQCEQDRIIQLEDESTFGKAVKKYGASLKELEHQYRNAKTVEDKGNIENEFSTLKSRISAEGLTGKSGLDDAKRAFKQIGQFAMTYGLIQNTVMQIP